MTDQSSLLLPTYIGEENARDTAPRVLSLLVTFGGIVATGQAALMARDRVLMRLEAAVAGPAKGSECGAVVLAEAGEALLPAEREVRRRNNLDKVHVVVVRVVGLLVRVVEGVYVVVRPGHGLGAHLLVHVVGQLGPEAKMVDRVGERVAALHRRLPVVLEVVHVHVAVAEAPAGRKVEVANDLVDAQATVDAAALMPLLVQLLSVVLALALLDPLALTKRPRRLRVRLPDLIACLAAAGLRRVARRGRAVAWSTVRGIQMRRGLIRGVANA